MSVLPTKGESSKHALMTKMPLALIMAFIGGILIEYIMRELYKQRLTASGKAFTESSSVVTYTQFFNEQENYGGLGIAILLLLIGYFMKINIVKFLGAGALGYVAGKFTHDALLPKITVS